MTDSGNPASKQEVFTTPSTTNGNGHASLSSVDEKAIFSNNLYPDDSFTPDGVYWADLPIGQRIKFVRQVDRAEAKKEWNSMRSMMKESFFSPVRWYFKNAVLPGAGLLLEG